MTTARGLFLFYLEQSFPRHLSPNGSHPAQIVDSFEDIEPFDPDREPQETIMSNVFQRYLEEATISRSSLHPAGNTLKFHRGRWRSTTWQKLKRRRVPKRLFFTFNTLNTIAKWRMSGLKQARGKSHEQYGQGYSQRSPR